MITQVAIKQVRAVQVPGVRSPACRAASLSPRRPYGDPERAGERLVLAAAPHSLIEPLLHPAWAFYYRNEPYLGFGGGRGNPVPNRHPGQEALAFPFVGCN
jgi:hypothetical protein